MRRRVALFTAIGAGLFLVTASGPRPAQPLAPALEASTDAGRRREWTPPDDEVLYRAARELGLGHRDPVVQARREQNLAFLGERSTHPDDAAAAIADDVVVHRRLVERMRERLAAAGVTGEPDDAELQAFLDRHRERFRLPPRVRFAHVFVSRARHADPLAAARALRERLPAPRDGQTPAAGDPLPFTLPAGSVSEAELGVALGQTLAADVFRLPPGQWSEPLPSPYGVHLVWVLDRQPAVDPPLAAVREAVRAAVQETQRAHALADGLARLRAAMAPAPARHD